MGREEGGGFRMGIIFLGSKITVDGDSSHEIKGHLLLGRKTIKNKGKGECIHVC